MQIPFNKKHVVHILYKNWKGEIGWRKIVPINVDFKTTKHHTTMQWILEAFDLDKQSHRSFAMQDINRWVPDTKVEEMRKAQ